MSRLAKLYASIADNRGKGIAFREFEKLLTAFGFVHDRTVGSHRQYKHPRVPQPLPVQPEGKDAKRYQVRQFLDIIEEFSLSMDE